MAGSKAEVWKVDLGGSRGHEQERQRPAIVWRDLDHIKMAIVIPCTRNLESRKFPYTHLISPNSKNGLEDESIALLFQIRSIDKSRFVKKLGELGEKDVEIIAAILKEMLRT